jgi:hypothetical protein
VATFSCRRATLLWKPRKTPRTAIAPHHKQAHIGARRPVGPTDTPLPSLGVSSLDLGRSPCRAALLCGKNPVLPRQLCRTAFRQLCDGAATAMQKNRLAFCAPHIYVFPTRSASSSLASLPSLGVSSLDLGRTVLRAAPFISGLRQQVGRLVIPGRPLLQPPICDARKLWHARASANLMEIALLRRNIRSVASQYISMRDGIAIRPPRAAPAARARLRTPWLPSPPACASACRSPCSW